MDERPDRTRAAAFAERVARQRGWLLNPDEAQTAEVLEGLTTNMARYGYYLCPCRDGEGTREADRDITCPCRYAPADLGEFGHCYCGLFVTPGFASQGRATTVIPERRPAPAIAAAVCEEQGRDLCSIREVVREIHQVEARLKGRYGLTLNEGICLCCIFQVVSTPGACAEQMGLSPSRVSRILNSLERKGLIERGMSRLDLRATDLRVTEEGRRRLAALRGGGFSFSRLDEAARAAGRSPAGE